MKRPRVTDSSSQTEISSTPEADVSQERVAVVLLQYGGPDDQDSVQPFLFNLFNDPYIVEAPAPVRYVLAHALSRWRAPTAKKIYAEMGGGSTILGYTKSQAEELQDVLSSDQFGLGAVKTFISMRYWHPMSDEAVRQVQSWKPDRIVLLPLYPQYARATTGSSYRVWQQAAEKIGLDVPTHLICCYPDEPGFIDGMARLTAEAYERASKAGSPRILFSAHGLPVRMIRKGDPYQAQVEQSCHLVMQATGLKDADWRICFQSKVGPMKWLEPDTEKEIEQAGHDGVPVVLVPIAFVSEHSETLVELDEEYGEVAQEAGVPAYERVPTINARMTYIDALAEQVRASLNRGTGIASYKGTRICSGDRSRCPCQLEPVASMAPAEQGWGDKIQ